MRREYSTGGNAVAELVLFDGAGEGWDRFVAAVGDSTYCHLAGWRHVMADVLGHECLYRVAVGADGVWLAILPLVRVRSRLFGHFLVSMPFLNAGGPVGTHEACAALVERAVADARQSAADLLELRTRQSPPAALHVSPRKVTVLLELPDSADALWEAFSHKLRSNIKRPRREGMELRFGAGEVDAFYEVFARNMRDLGTPVLPRRFFERIASTFPEEALFAAVYSGSQPVAGQCAFRWRDELEMVWGSSLREFNRHKPMSLVHWAFMERAIGLGVKRFNFGRCTPGSGTHRFKTQWGGVDVPLPWGEWSPRDVISTPSPEHGAYRIATAVWKRVPLAVANRLGPYLATRLP